MSDRRRAKDSAEGWLLVRTGSRQATRLEVPTIPAEVSTPAGDVRFAVGEHGEARLLLPLESGEDVPEGIGAPALRIKVSQFGIEGRPARFLDLSCLEPDLEAVFAEVADAILRRIATGQRCVDAAASTIEEFRALLLRAAAARVERATVSGLVGELFVLNRLLDRSPDAWIAWRGPLGDRHDFRTGDHALEIKTTTRVGHTVVIISSIEQMSEPAGGTLHLLHLTLEPTAGGLLTVSALARNTITKAGQAAGIRDRLAALGCADADAPEWNATAFRYEHESLFEVGPGFPRLAPELFPGKKLPSGVSGVTYRLDLVAAAAFRRDDQVLTVLEKELAGCP